MLVNRNVISQLYVLCSITAYIISYLLFKRLFYLLPWQHVFQGSKLILSNSEQSLKFSTSSFKKGLSCILVMASPLSHIIWEKRTLRISSSCSALNTPGFSYQNLKYKIEINVENLTGTWLLCWKTWIDGKQNVYYNVTFFNLVPSSLKIHQIFA